MTVIESAGDAVVPLVAGVVTAGVVVVLVAGVVVELGVVVEPFEPEAGVLLLVDPPELPPDFDPLPPEVVVPPPLLVLPLVPPLVPPEVPPPPEYGTALKV